MSTNNFTENSIDHSNTNTHENHTPIWKFWKRKRHIVVFMIFYGMLVNFTIRTLMSVAIVSMTEEKVTYLPGGVVITHQEFSWNSKEKGLILSSLFYGYMSTQFISGYLTCKFDCSIIFATSLGFAALFTILTPIIAYHGLAALVIVRILEGCFEGFAFVASIGIISKWIPPAERSKLTSISIMGTQLGNIAAMLLSGILAKHFGWQSIFLAFGTNGLIWLILWIIIVRECPSKDRFMSENERQYILESLKMIPKDKPPVPWKSIFTSWPVIAIAAGLIAESWGAFTMLTCLPMFLSDTMGFTIQNTGLLSSVPYISVVCALPISGWLADYLITKKKISPTKIRQWYITGGFLIHSLCFVLVALIMHPISSIACVTIGVTFGTISFSALYICCLDISAQFGSLIYGIGNTFGTMSGVISPLVTGFIVRNGTAYEWQIIFYISAIVYVIGAAIFFCIGTAEQQPWDLEKERGSNKP